MTAHTKQPEAVGLYDPRFEHDACGVGMVARLDNVPSHEVVAQAIEALENLEHRGASGADPTTGDGAGILMQMPDELLRAVLDFDLPPPGRYGVLMCFLPRAEEERERLRELLERAVRAEGQVALGWREVPVDTAHTGRTAGACRPAVWQLFVGAGELPTSAGAADAAGGGEAGLGGAEGAGRAAGEAGLGGAGGTAGEAAFDLDAFER